MGEQNRSDVAVEDGGDHVVLGEVVIGDDARDAVGGSELHLLGDVGGAGVKRTDVRYLGWGSPIGGVWFPASIEVWVEDKRVRRTSVSQVDRNVAFDATLFQIK